MLYPVCANLSLRVREELHSFLKDRNDAYLACVLDSSGNVREADPLGQIDGKQGGALRAVLELGASDAPSLREHVGEDVAATAWNNRLLALTDKGILIEVSTGRNNIVGASGRSAASPGECQPLQDERRVRRTSSGPCSPLCEQLDC